VNTDSGGRLGPPHSHFYLVAAAIALACVLVGGCRKPSLETVPVCGTVRYMGKPWPVGLVMFRPVDAAHGRPATVAISPDGTYDVKTLNDSRGLVPGEYVVTVVTESPLDAANGPGGSGKKGGAAAGAPKRPQPGIKLTVKAEDKARTFDISLDGG
jgi:hypothetical protein